jgi:glycosyltransferase involved in cell wall biosynthesis
LILHSRYRSGPVSGENRVVDDEVRLLAEAGHQVELISPSLGNPSRVELLKAGIRMVWSRSAVAQVANGIERIRPDVVHCHNLFPSLSPSVLRAAAGLPVVLTLHNYRLLCLPGILFRNGNICQDCLGRAPWPGVLHGCYQGSISASLALGASLTLHGKMATFDQVARYLAISQFVREKHIEGGLPPERIIVKPHFAWPTDIRDSPGDYFLYLGRLSPEKGVATLIDAARRIPTRLLVVGAGPEASKLRSIAPPTVEFVPTVLPSKAQQLIRSARAMIVPSLSYEGAGRVVLEAYAAGVPVIATRLGGLPEVVNDGVTGVLVPPGNGEALASAIEMLLEESVSERMGNAAFQLWRNNYDPKSGLARLEKTYRSAGAQYPPP